MKLGNANSLGLGIVFAIGLHAPIASGQQDCGEWVEVPSPAGATVAITSVSALSAVDAWALNGALGTIHWDGTVWSQVPLPDLGSLGSSFDLRAMGTAGSAIGICGVVSTGAWTSEQLLLIWDGGQWDRIESVELASSNQPRNGAPRAIDGVTPNDMWVVGTASSYPPGGPPHVVLTVHWDGSQLVEYITPGLGSRQNHLYDVAMIASDDGWAVGEFTSWGPEESGALHGMTFHWDGTSWNIVPNPTETMDSVHLHQVAAVSTNDVWAAGQGPGGPLFMHWDGASWTIVPSPIANGGIYQLAAIASDNVWAVHHPGQLPLISSFLHWDGSAWSVAATPDYPGATSVSRAAGLAAAGPCDLWAVGSINFGAGALPFIERLRPNNTTDVPPLVGGGLQLEVTPNPVRHSARISFDIPGDSYGRARIYDIRGQLVKTLANRPEGDKSVSWDGRDDLGRWVSGGVYFLRVDSKGGQVLRQKITVVR